MERTWILLGGGIGWVALGLANLLAPPRTLSYLVHILIGRAAVAVGLSSRKGDSVSPDTKSAHRSEE